MPSVVSQKYSKALLEVAQEKNQLESILAEVDELTKVCQDNQLSDFFDNDVYSFEMKSEIIDSLKTQASDLMKNFLDTVRANGRLASLTDILVEVKTTADEMFKISDVEVVSSVVLTEDQVAKVKTLAQSKFDLNEVTINNTVDETILGGFVIHSRDKVIDASIKTQLAKMASQIL